MSDEQARLDELIDVETERILFGLDHEPTLDDCTLARMLALSRVTGDSRYFRRAFHEVMDREAEQILSRYGRIA